MLLLLRVFPFLTITIVPVMINVRTINATATVIVIAVIVKMSIILAIIGIVGTGHCYSYNHQGCDYYDCHSCSCYDCVIRFKVIPFTSAFIIAMILIAVKFQESLFGEELSVKSVLGSQTKLGSDT